MKKKNMTTKAFDVNPKFVILSKKNPDRQGATSESRRTGGPIPNPISPSPEENLSTEDLIGALTESGSPKSAPVLSHFSSSHVQEYPSLGSANKNAQSRNSSAHNGISTQESYQGRHNHNSLTDDLSRQLTNSSPTSEAVNSVRTLQLSTSAKGSASLVMSSGSKKYQPPAMKSSTLLSSAESGTVANLDTFGLTSESVQRTSTDAAHRNQLAHPVQILTRTSSQLRSAGSATDDKVAPVATINSFLSNTNTTTSETVTTGSGITVSNLLKLKLAGNTAPKIVSNNNEQQPSFAPGTYSSSNQPQYTASSVNGSQLTQSFSSAPSQSSMSHQLRSMSEQLEQQKSSSAGGRSSMNPNAPSWTPPEMQHSMPYGMENRWDAPEWFDENQLEYQQMQSQMNWNGFNPNAPPFMSKHREYGAPNQHLPPHMHQYSGGASNFSYSAPEMFENQPLGAEQEPYTTMSSLPVNQVITSDLSYGGYDAGMEKSQQLMGARRSKSLLPDSSHVVRPMRPPSLPSSENAVQSCLFCGGEATLECSTCALIRRRLGVDVRAFFCSVAHQQKCWKQHHESVHQQYTIPQKKSTPVPAISPLAKIDEPVVPLSSTSSTPSEPVKQWPTEGRQQDLDAGSEEDRTRIADLSGTFTEVRATIGSADTSVSTASSFGNVPQKRAGINPGTDNSLPLPPSENSSSMNIFLSSMLTVAGSSNHVEAEFSNVSVDDRHLTGEGADLESLGNSILNDGMMEDGMSLSSPLNQPARSIAIDAS